mgnify:CR=1 FL=1
MSHPPLGKLIISIGIAMFGMVPFGWRFMGTLFGVLMGGGPPPPLHRASSDSHRPSSRGALDAVIRKRAAVMGPRGSASRLSYYVLPLFLSGLFWGVGCASKWTVVYAGAGLALAVPLGGGVGEVGGGVDHQRDHTPHPYQSNWYQWILDARPILYYQDFSVQGMRPAGEPAEEIGSIPVGH